MLPLVAALLLALADAPANVAVERADGERWQTVDASTVFRGGDEVRFRFRASQAGFLYVVNETIRGERAWLLTDRAVENGREYTIPAGDGAFRFAEQPGYETVYFIVSPVRLPDRPVIPIAPAAKNTLLPRCSDGPLRARGVCVDHQAGGRPARTIKVPDATLAVYELRLAHK